MHSMNNQVVQIDKWPVFTDHTYMHYKPTKYTTQSDQIVSYTNLDSMFAESKKQQHQVYE